MFQAEIGISGVDLAIADTGSLLVQARPGQERVTSLLPRTHVALVHETQIVPDMNSAFAWLAEQPLSDNVTLITGPSKTGDIELQLTTGVHGPGHWHVLLVDDEAARGGE